MPGREDLRRVRRTWAGGEHAQPALHGHRLEDGVDVGLADERQAAGAFDREMAVVTIPQRKGEPLVVRADESVRPDTTIEGLAKLGARAPIFACDALRQARSIVAGRGAEDAQGRRAASAAGGGETCQSPSRIACVSGRNPGSSPASSSGSSRPPALYFEPIVQCDRAGAATPTSDMFVENFKAGRVVAS